MHQKDKWRRAGIPAAAGPLTQKLKGRAWSSKAVQ